MSATHAIRRLLQSQRGQSAVELALVLLPLLLLLLGFFDVGRAVLHYNVISNAAREGARYGVIASRSLANICTVALGAAASPATPGSSCDGSGNASAATGDGTVTVAVPTRGTTTGAQVQVTVDYAFSPVTTGFLPVANTITLHAASTMYVE